MTKNKFNPEDWLQNTEPAPTTNIRNVVSNTPQTSIEEDIETITQRIESAHIDITAGYDN
ncbi:MAG: hypothetical protein NC115_05235 [Bacteroidales bacterium]|nr:hypothetical protein [Bacteroidales bacterium]